jgi:hypothetical protein
MTFSGLAVERRLSSVSPYLGELQWNVDADGALQRPAPRNVQGILRLLPRRALEPALVNSLFNEYPHRTLERALIAWDVARSTLLGVNDGQLMARLANELTTLKEIGVGADGAAISRERIAELVEAARPPNHEKVLDDYLALPSLGALVAIASAFHTLDDKPALAAVTLDHVRLLADAHLPSLALAFLQILWDRFRLHWALDLMIDIAVDYEQLDAVPQIDPHDDRSARQKAYGLLRAHLAMRDIDAASALEDSLLRIPAIRHSTDPSLLLTKVELALLANKQIDLATVEAVNAMVPSESEWRFAVQVRDSITLLRTKPHSAAVVLAGYIARFGNRFEMWSRAAQHRPARGDLLKRLSRELRYLSHDPEAWRALALFTSDSDEIYVEIEQRLQSQLDAALS